MSRLVTSSVALALAWGLAAPGAVLAQQDYGNYPPPGAAYPPASAVPNYSPSYAPAPFVQEELDSLLAPVALYPDQLLAQILMSATYPQDVVQAQRFLRQNPNLRGAALDDAIARMPWDPSVQSLTAFPQVLDMLAGRIDWTRRLGEAYLNDQDWVMDTVQDLRWRAHEAGNLASSPQQTVLLEDRTIYIEPAAPDVIYVPTYNPLVIYGPWWAPAYVPYYWRPPRTYYPGVVITTGYMKFGVPYRVTQNHWGWARPDWRQRHIVIDVQRPNQFVERRPYYRQWAREGWWEHRRADTRFNAPREGQQYRGRDGAPNSPVTGGNGRRNDRAPVTGGQQGRQPGMPPSQTNVQPGVPPQQGGSSPQRDYRQSDRGQRDGQHSPPQGGTPAPQAVPVVPSTPAPQNSPVVRQAPHAVPPAQRAPVPQSVPVPSQAPAMRQPPPAPPPTPQAAPVQRAPTPQAVPVVPHTPQVVPAAPPQGGTVPQRVPAPPAPPPTGGPQGSASPHGANGSGHGQGHGDRGPSGERSQQGSEGGRGGGSRQGSDR